MPRMCDAENRFLDFLVLYQQYQERSNQGLFAGSPSYGVYRAEIPELDFVLERSCRFNVTWLQSIDLVLEIRLPDLLISSVITFDDSMWVNWIKFQDRSFKRIDFEYVGDITRLDEACFWLNLMMPVDFPQS